MLPNGECLCGFQRQRLERVGEAEAERQGCSHTFYSGLFACLIAVCMCVCACRSCRWAFCTMSLNGCVCVWLYVHMVLCACVCVPEHSVESVVVYRLTVTDKHTLTTGVKKLNALYALFFPRRLPLSASLTFSPPIFIFYIFLSVILSCFFSLPDDFFLLLPPLSLHL